MKRGRLWQRWLIKLVNWREKHLQNKSFVFLLAVITGIFGGLAAVVLKSIVFFIQQLVTGDFYLTGILFVLFPALGILLTVLYKHYLQGGKLGHGIPNILYNITHKAGVVERDKTYSHIVSSSLTVGFGGSVGLEAPIVTTGSAIGSNLARLFKLDQEKRRLFIGCGAAAAIGGIFNAPIAGVIFTLEVLLLQLAIPAYIPLLIASVTGTIISMYMMGGDIFLFNFILSDPFHLREIPVYVILGIITGLISVYFSRTAIRSEIWIGQVSNPFKRAITGGLILGLLILVFPPLYGEGFNTLRALFDGDSSRLLTDSIFFQRLADERWFLLLFIGVMIFVKVIAAAITIGAGGNGGIFAPSLFVGGLTGYLTANLINMINVLPYRISEENFVLVGMAGIKSGVMHAPLTAIFLIAEITGGYMLILPLIIVSAIAFATTTYFEPHSIYTKQLARKGHLPFQNRERTVLTLMKLRNIIEKDLITVRPEDTLRQLVDAVSRSHRNIFPVVDNDGYLRGIVPLDNIREIMFKPKMYDTVKTEDLMEAIQTYVNIDDPMHIVMHKFDESGNWNLPVIEGGKYLGFISKAKIFSHYRQMLNQQAKHERGIIE